MTTDMPTKNMVRIGGVLLLLLLFDGDGADGASVDKDDDVGLFSIVGVRMGDSDAVQLLPLSVLLELDVDGLVVSMVVVGIGVGSTATATGGSVAVVVIAVVGAVVVVVACACWVMSVVVMGVTVAVCTGAVVGVAVVMVVVGMPAPSHFKLVSQSSATNSLIQPPAASSHE
jgi:hypothetical protein